MNHRGWRKFLGSQGFTNAASSIIAILVGLLVGFVILLFSDSSRALEGLGTILMGGFLTGAKGVGQVLYFATPIIMTGLSVGFAFKTGLFNIGAAGQFIVGGFVAVYVGVKWTFLGELSLFGLDLSFLHWLVAILCGMAAGGIWALVPGLFKAYLNVNEVISSIMMNYIGMYGVNYCVKSFIYNSTKAQTLDVAPTAVLPKAGLDKLFYNQVGKLQDVSGVSIGIIIAIVIAVVMYIILNKTVFGYELKACGYNRHASRYAGINERKTIVVSMVIAGCLAAIGGALLYLASTNGKHIKPIEVLAVEGFNGIPVALLGLSNPIGTVFSGLFISYITLGGEQLQKLGYVKEVIDIVIAVIIYFSAFALVFRQFVARLVKGKRPSRDLPKVEGAGLLPPEADGGASGAPPQAQEAPQAEEDK